MDGRRRWSRFRVAREASLLTFVSSGTLRWQLHQFQPHLAYTRVDQANLPGYAIGYINFASFLVGTPIINANNLKFSVVGVDDADPGTKWQVGMRCAQTLAVEPLPVCRLLAVELRSLPAGIADPDLDGFHRGA